VAELTDAERKSIAYALRHPRGRYTAERAAQLSGVPKSTVYDWRRESVYEPDFSAGRPVMWSYRDLALLRLLAWLRQGGMDRPVASEKVSSVKAQLSAGLDEARLEDDRENILPWTDFSRLLGTFDLHEPIDELRSARRGPVWAPDLVTPSQHSYISPWVVAVDPCIERTRIPTAAIHALHAERALPLEAIVELYPGLTTEAASDAIRLERRLRGFDAPEPVAA
jgi:uncharacterized protein (DUF433 family)